jgi:hypothetical protein
LGANAKETEPAKSSNENIIKAEVISLSKGLSFSIFVFWNPG